MSYTPQTWVDDDATKPLSADRMNHIETGIEDADNRVSTVEARVRTPQAITYAATITPDASAGALFYCIATGNLTLAEPTNPVNGKLVTVMVKASGANRVLTLPDGLTVTIPTGEWWTGSMLYLSNQTEWILTDGL